jgi:ArsR family transcriptional regulator
MSKEIKFVCCGADPKSLQNLSNDRYSDDDAISILKKIAHPLRLKILRILVQQSEICSCELTQLFDETQPEVSRQLGILTSSGILERRILTIKGISGRWHAYSIKQSRRQLIAHLIQPFTNKGI